LGPSLAVPDPIAIGTRTTRVAMFSGYADASVPRKPSTQAGTPPSQR